MGGTAERRKTSRRSRAQAGVTLVEVLVVIAVLIPVVLAATLGLLTTAKLSYSTKVSQELNAAAASYAESLKDLVYVECADPTDYEGDAEVWTPPGDADLSVDILTVEYWDQAAAGYQTAAGCPSTDQGAQLITVRTVDAESDVELTVVKRNPVAAP